MTREKADVVLGAQWGDEGKGKLVDLLAGDCDLVARCQGGNNAGHTVVVGERRYAFHLLPSGAVHPSCRALIGNGVVIHLPGLFAEIAANELPDWEKRLFVSARAHLVFDFHQRADGIQEGRRAGSGLGTTRKGIGPAYASKAARSGIRVCDLIGDFDRFRARFSALVDDFKRQFPELEVDVEGQLEEYRGWAEKIRPLVRESVSLIHAYLREGRRVLVEGANASMLDIDFGTYPFVTSSNCAIGGVCTGLGVPPSMIGRVYGVVKAYTTRVGTGSFPTELVDDVGVYLQDKGFEFGTTTGRKRRCGWLDLAMLRYTGMINGYTALALTKLDVLTGLTDVKICVDYDGDPNAPYPVSEDDMAKAAPTMITLPGWNEDITGVRTFEALPENARNYVLEIEKRLGVDIWWIGVGQEREAMIHRRQ